MLSLGSSSSKSSCPMSSCATDNNNDSISYEEYDVEQEKLTNIEDKPSCSSNHDKPSCSHNGKHDIVVHTPSDALTYRVSLYIS